ncbi:MAG: DNA replication/repair protein RecF [Gammaproteobacteria bacterium]|nr:DNA replication/repair protein RecF [Gammaproteobacteria bacterium]
MLKRLTVKDYRCFDSAELELAPEINWIIGKNASGKTSLLEAIFYLGHGRSFRTSRIERAIRAGSDSLEVVARVESHSGEVVLGMARSSSEARARLGGKPLESLAAAARLLPVVVLDSEMNRLISEGPAERRRWLDWGVFHVEPKYQQAWQVFRKALRQRNEGLKQRLPAKALQPWTEQLVSAGLRVDAYRQAFFEAIEPLATEYARHLLDQPAVSLEYQRGWAEGESYGENLLRHQERDYEQGITRYGPHRAEVRMLVEGVAAQERVSRGQLKILAGALWLAQVQLYNRRIGSKVVLLVDDLAAELDSVHLERFIDLLKQQDCQLILTAISPEDIGNTHLEGGHVFHVEHGRISPVSEP